MNGEFRKNLKDVTGQSAFDASMSGHLPNAFNLNSNLGQKEALLGLDSGSADSLQSRGIALSKHQEDTRKRAERSRKSNNDIVLLDMLEKARAEAAQVAREVAEIEAEYQAKYGDAWREHISMEIFGPDEVPERKEGESITEYRERLDREMVAQMIDPATGKVKEEYADSPHKRWAERRYRQLGVDANLEIAEDETRPQEEREQALKSIIDSGDEQRMGYAIAQVRQDSNAYAKLDDGLDDAMQETMSESDLQNEELAFFGPQPS